MKTPEMQSLQSRLEFAFSNLPSDQRKKSALAKYCKIAASSVNDWFNGKSKSIRGEALELASEYLNVRAMWLISGRGPYQRIALHPSRVSPHGQAIPILNLDQVEMYLTGGIDSLPSDTEYTHSHIKLSEGSYALKVIDLAMEYRFEKGDIAIIDPETEVCPGDFVLGYIDDSQLLFRQYRQMYKRNFDLFSLSPVDPCYLSVRSDECDIKIIGVMVEHRKIRKQPVFNC